MPETLTREVLEARLSLLKAGFKELQERIAQDRESLIATDGAIQNTEYFLSLLKPEQPDESHS